VYLGDSIDDEGEIKATLGPESTLHSASSRSCSGAEALGNEMISKDEILRAQLSLIQINLNALDLSNITEAISEGVGDAIELTELAEQKPRHAALALTKARYVLQVIIYDLYQLAYRRAPGTEPLGNHIGKLISDKKLPKRVRTSVNLVLDLGNSGTHDEPKDATRDDAVSCLEQLMVVVKWYCERRYSDFVEGPRSPQDVTSPAFRSLEHTPSPDPIPPESTTEHTPVKMAEIESPPNIQTAGSVQQSIQTFSRPEIFIHRGITFVCIKPGKFKLGEPNKERTYRVEKPFWISEAPITWREWREFDKSSVHRSGTGLPAVNISREFAEAYCASIGGELPTEEEWECAARGALDSRRYPWGNEPQANRANCASIGAIKCGSYGRNSFGLVDVIGNVWEWCAGPFDPRFKMGVVRGGSWRERLEDIAVWSRQKRDPSQPPGNDTGFRCILRSKPKA